MSNEDLLKQDPLVAPADSDEQFIIRLEYEDPIRKASIWLHKLIIHRLRDVQLAAPWYRGETDEPPDRFVSCVTMREGGGFLRRDYVRRIDELAESIITISGRVSDEFLRIERIRRGEISEHATKADLEPVAALASACKHMSSEVLADVASVCKHGAKSLDRKADALLAVAGETLATAKRIDRRGKRANPRQTISMETQEQCWRYWDVGRKNAEVRSNAKGKAQHAFVFSYYRRELKALGITTESQFKKALKLRSNRISRTAAKK